MWRGFSKDSSHWFSCNATFSPQATEPVSTILNAYKTYSCSNALCIDWQDADWYSTTNLSYYLPKDKMFNKYRLFASIFILSIPLLTLLTWQRQGIASASLNTVENIEVTAAFENAYKLLATPFDQVDLNQFADAFIDHPDYAAAIDSETQAKLRKQIAHMLGNAAGPPFGYLTAMKVKRLYQQKGAVLLNAGLQKAKAENRELTSEEWQEIAKQNGGYTPALPNHELDQNQPILEYKSVQVNGDKARVVFDNGITTSTAILVKVNGKWFVAGIF